MEKRIVDGKECRLQAAADVHSHETFERISRVYFVAHNCFSVRRPCGQVQALAVRTAREHAFVSITAIDWANDEPVFSRFRIVVAHESELLPVGRKCNVRIDISYQLLWRAAQQRSSIQKLQLWIPRITANKIEIISVPRETQPVVVQIGRWLYLGITVGGHISQPKACQSPISGHAEDVLAIRRDGDVHRIAGIGNLGNGNILERSGESAVEKSVDPISSRCYQYQHNSRNHAGAEFVLPGGRDHSGTAGDALSGGTFSGRRHSGREGCSGRCRLRGLAARVCVTLQPPEIAAQLSARLIA